MQQLLVEKVLNNYGRTEVLFYIAVTSGVAAIHEEEEIWDQVVKVNLKGAYLPNIWSRI